MANVLPTQLKPLAPVANGSTKIPGARGDRGPWLGRSLLHPTVIGMFHCHKILSGSQLARLLGVGRSSAHLILEKLAEDRVIQVVERDHSKPQPPGRPSTDYRLDSARGIFMGVSVRAHQATWSALAFDGSTIASGALPGTGTKASELASRIQLLFDDGGVLSAFCGLVLHTVVARASTTTEGEPIRGEMHLPFGNGEVVPCAVVGAIAESLEDPSKLASILFVRLLDNFHVEAAVATGGRVLAGSHGINLLSRELASSRSVYLAKLDGERRAQVEKLSWSELMDPNAPDAARELSAILRDRLAATLFDINELMSPTRIVLVAEQSTFAEVMASAVGQRLEYLGRAHGNVAPPKVTPRPSGEASIAKAAAFLPIATVIVRCLEFERARPTRDARFGTREAFLPLLEF